MSTEDSHYTDEFIDRLETLWGEGFLSPGGAEKVQEIVKGVDLAGKSVPDIGCGGVAANTIARIHDRTLTRTDQYQVCRIGPGALRNYSISSVTRVTGSSPTVISLVVERRVSCHTLSM